MKVTSFKDLSTGEDNLIVKTVTDIAERNGRDGTSHDCLSFSRIFRLVKDLEAVQQQLRQELKLQINFLN